MEILIILAVAVAGLYWMSSRQRKQQRAAMDFRSQLAPGQEVMTTSGLFGTIVEVDEDADVITLETEPGGSTTRWLRAAIAKLVEPPAVDEEEAEEATDAAAAEDAVADDGLIEAEVDPRAETRKDLPDDVVVPDDLSGLDQMDAPKPDAAREPREDGTDSSK